MPRLSLTARAFLLSFLPVCLVLACTFAALSTANHRRITEELRQSLQQSDNLLNRAGVEYARQTSALAAKLTDSAGLKAAVGLLAEAHGNPAAISEIRRTIEAQLRELQSSTAYDFAAIADLSGHTVAGVVAAPQQQLRSLPPLPSAPGLDEIQGALYRLEPVPIEIGGEVAAVLILGTRFELHEASIGGEAVLLHGDKVEQSTLPARWNCSIARELHRCIIPISGCELVLEGRSFVVSELDSLRLGDKYRLLGFRSLDTRVRDFNAAFVRILIEVGAAGVLLALLSTLVTSYSVSQPLRSLVAQLRHGESAGQLPARLTLQNGVRELDSLVTAFNRVADAERRSRHELEAAKNAAEAGNRIKTEFLANVSHELRTPMNGILGMTQVLLGTPLTGDQQEYAAVVRDSAESLMALIENVLNFSSLEAGKLQLTVAALDLNEMVASVADSIRPRAERKRIHVEISYPAAQPSTLAGDRTRLQQVLIHLADNAVKFTSTGVIRIRCECVRQDAAAALVKFSVQDTGIGIDPRNADLLFKKFSQVDGSFTRRYGGTGLGLAIAKEMIELMHGEIGFDSRVNAGSTFWFTVPLAIEKRGFALEDRNATAGGVLAC